MIKYDSNLINKYINSEYISEVERLEGTIDFMIAVIDTTNDYKLYNICSDTLKINYEFVSYLIDKFTFVL